MAWPLIVLAAGAVGAVAAAKRHEAKAVALFPGESDRAVSAQPGAIVTCGIYGVFDHTGIVTSEGIVELHGSGLVRCVSPERFLEQRSGEQIYIACDGLDQALCSPKAEAAALAKVFTYLDYDVIHNNCHKFVYECFTGQRLPMTQFTELNHALAKDFGEKVHWHRLALDV